MKTRKIILLIAFTLGLLGFWLMTAFTTRNACEYANSNLQFIKSEIENAVVSTTLDMAKYHAYKALNGIEKTRGNFLDCGCEGTIESLESTQTELKLATKAESLKDSKLTLHKALENTMIGMKVLQVFEQETSSNYNDDILVMNTKEVLDNQNPLFLTQNSSVKEQVHSCLLGFETSLEKVVTDVDCEDAHRFITNIYEESRLILLNTKLSPHKKAYHQRVMTLSEEALEKLGSCKQ
ncbi:hypothetical protein [Flagellimonas aequoris]|uniref:DUF4142 domain-containing protein n=2 Tax=Flagellimonas aequoris TaxID=2306997 RepID=A0ABY3KSQ1_9FLAO|nr:hypothetical protein [Allomuricauda aequoris]TXK01508.1 hypothetical protein FQ019_12170 [Allomuricauda aequoris]